jgi:signal transduction histidine kinase
VLDEVSAQLMPVPNLGDTRADLVAIVDNAVRLLTGTHIGRAIAALVSDLARKTPQLEAFRRRLVDARQQELRNVLERGVTRGELRGDLDTETAADLLLGPVYYRVLFAGRQPEAGYAERVVDAFLRSAARTIPVPMPQTNQDQMRAVLDAAIAVTSELSLDAVLQRIVESAAKLTDAKYAALGVIDQSGAALENFVTTGLDDETVARIGDLPRGRGILGVLIHDAEPLRLGNIASDPRSVGFPPNHPPMKSFLGVPILLRGVAYGNLYLTEKAHGDEFTEEDQELVQLLASQAAVAIENARLYESATRWGEQLESLAEVGNALATELELPRLLELVVTRLRGLIDARVVFIAMPGPEGETVVETVAGADAAKYAGLRLGPARSKSARVLERRRSERVDALIDDPEVDQQTARRLGARTGLFVPLVVRDRAIGVIVAQDKQQPDPRFTDEDVRIAEAFAERAAVAIDLSERVARDALRRVVAGQELERQRLARELHDETGQALTSILLGLKGIEEAADTAAARQSVLVLRELVVSTLQDVRRLAVELRPTALDDFGLVPALERLSETFAEQADVDVDVQAVLGESRLPSEIETALYRIVQEALTNVVKHANAKRVSVVLTRQGDRVAVVIEDDGRGFDPASQPGEGLGLMGMRERIALVDGRLSIESGAGRGTTIAVEVPLR